MCYCIEQSCTEIKEFCRKHKRKSEDISGCVAFAFEEMCKERDFYYIAVAAKAKFEKVNAVYTERKNAKQNLEDRKKRYRQQMEEQMAAHIKEMEEEEAQMKKKRQTGGFSPGRSP